MKEMKNKFFKLRKGNASLTVELMFASLLAVYGLFVLNNIVTDYSYQRQALEILTSSAVAVSRYGGNNSNAGKVNGLGGPIDANANATLSQYSAIIDPQVTCSPDKITASNPSVTCDIYYTRKNAFLPGVGDTRQHYSISLTKPVVEPGDLL